MAGPCEQGGRTPRAPLSPQSGLSAVGWPDKVCQDGDGVLQLRTFWANTCPPPLVGLGWKREETAGCEAGGCKGGQVL